MDRLVSGKYLYKSGPGLILRMSRIIDKINGPPASSRRHRSPLRRGLASTRPRIAATSATRPLHSLLLYSDTAELIAMLLHLTAVFAVFFVLTNASPTPTNNKEGGPIGDLPENWDQTKDDNQSLFLNKSDKNDLEPYPLALSEEGNMEGYEGMDQRFDPSNGELDNLIMRPELYGEPPAMESLSVGYESRRRKRGSGTKVGGAGAATKVATKSGSGKKNLKSEDHLSPVDSAAEIEESQRHKRGSGTKVGGAAASAKTATKNSGGNKKNLRPENRALSPVDSAADNQESQRYKRGSGTKVGGAAASAKSATKNSGGNKKNFMGISERRKRDSGLSAGDVRALLSLWEAQERRKQEYAAANQLAADSYYGRSDEDQPDVDENAEVWYNDPMVIDSRQQYPQRSYFSEQNRMAMSRYPDMYQVDPSELAQRYEEARRKRQYANKVKRFMVARKRSEGGSPRPANYRPREDLYTLAELLRSSPRVNEQDLPVYRRLIL